jgi:carbon starvation protein
MLQDLMGHIYAPLGRTGWMPGLIGASAAIVLAWGYFLYEGVRDPLGGINSLWPLFGIANQLLAAIALCLATTILLKMQLQDRPVGAPRMRPSFALITLIPLAWLLAVTMTAGWQKIFHEDPRIGFLAAAKGLDAKLPVQEQALAATKSAGDVVATGLAEKAWHTNRTLHFNNVLDACVAGFFMLMVAAMVLLSAREWVLLMTRRKRATLRETEPVWLPDYALAEGRPLNVVGLVAVGCALAKELSGEAHLERAQATAAVCHCMSGKLDLPGDGSAVAIKAPGQLYVEMTEKRFDGVNRCC